MADRRLRSLASLVVLALGSGCVSQGKYDAAVADSVRTRALLKQGVAREQSQREQSQREFERSRALLAESDARCDRVARDAEALASTLSLTTEELHERLETLERAQRAAESRAALFREMALRLKKMIDAGDLRIVLRSGRMVLILPNDVLFDSGKAALKPRGKEALTEIAAALATLAGRRFQVAGHTDDQPIRFSGYTSNWQLSTERGLSVVAFLQKAGVDPRSLSAAGYGEFDPLRPNDTDDDRSLNRRIEITVQPNIDESVAVPEPIGPQ
jgi:chemotaxis protein MotB